MYALKPCVKPPTQYMYPATLAAAVVVAEVVDEVAAIALTTVELLDGIVVFEGVDFPEMKM